jgi:nucleolar protein 56
MSESLEELRKKMIEGAKGAISSAYESEEYALMQAINAYLQINKSYNLVYERLSEWFGLYFPELNISNPKTLSDLAISAAKGELTSERVEEIVGKEGNPAAMAKKIRETIGRKGDKEEKDALLEFAKLSNNLYDTLNSLENYINGSANRLMPNITYLTDAKIAAELLSKAGSLEKLALMPASTVQLLGAEKALFKHIKFGSKPPKYGVLFKLQKVSNGRKDIRGRIARLYATKISIASKADYFSKRFIAEGLKKTLDEGIKKIESEPVKIKKREQFYRKPHRRRFQRK